MKIATLIIFLFFSSLIFTSCSTEELPDENSVLPLIEDSLTGGEDSPEPNNEKEKEEDGE